MNELCFSWLRKRDSPRVEEIESSTIYVYLKTLFCYIVYRVITETVLQFIISHFSWYNCAYGTMYSPLYLWRRVPFIPPPPHSSPFSPLLPLPHKLNNPSPLSLWGWLSFRIILIQLWKIILFCGRTVYVGASLCVLVYESVCVIIADGCRWTGCLRLVCCCCEECCV